MLSKTLQYGPNDYVIGTKIRALRLKKKIGLVDLGKHTGRSPALLSTIERGRVNPLSSTTGCDSHLTIELIVAEWVIRRGTLLVGRMAT